MEGFATAISTGIETCFTTMGTVLTEAIGNPLVMVFMAAGFIGIGVGVFKKLKKTAK